MSILMEKILPVVGEVGKNRSSAGGDSGEKDVMGLCGFIFVPVTSWSFGRFPEMDRKRPEF